MMMPTVCGAYGGFVLSEDEDKTFAPTTTTRARTGKEISPFRLKSLTAEELAKMPHYYIMDLDKGMAETVASVMPPRPR